MEIAEVKLKYHPKRSELMVTNSIEAANIAFEHVFDEDTIGHKESFYVILTDQGSHVLGFSEIAVGGVSRLYVDIRILMQTVLLSNASGIVVVHNHPSGTMIPSKEDDDTTRRIKDACSIFGVRMMDHIIVTPYRRYYSYADMGLC